MKRILLVMAVGLVMAAIVVAMSVPAFAYANHTTGSGSLGGQSRALDQCEFAVDKQDTTNQGHQNSNDPGNIAPANCDHYFQD